MKKCAPQSSVNVIHPLLVLAAYLLYQALYFGRFGHFGRIFLAVVMAMSVAQQQSDKPSHTPR
ncbi:Uncharacterized protein ChrSV_4878 [Chromobacterium vaccinii]|nr:Uncharacterized protein ChrSW_4872 [Chromobacterium vaccinii]QND92333.1 Uncharacterized protein ChrSV_4878 [Chromobacterium vaccinii]